MIRRGSSDILPVRLEKNAKLSLAGNTGGTRSIRKKRKAGTDYSRYGFVCLQHLTAGRQQKEKRDIGNDRQSPFFKFPSAFLIVQGTVCELFQKKL